MKNGGSETIRWFFPGLEINIYSRSCNLLYKNNLALVYEAVGLVIINK